MNGLVSVIMGVYRPEYVQLQQAISSILDQSYSNLEFIICDDGSDDGTYDWLLLQAKTDSRLKIICNRTNKGLAFALNRCLEYVKGQYIARQDADDYSAPNRLEKQVEFLCTHPHCHFVGSCSGLFDQNGVYAIKNFMANPCKKDFLFAVPFIHGSLLFRTNCLLQHKYHVNKRTFRTQDYELLMRLYSAGCKGYNLQLPLYFYREDAPAKSRRKYCYRIDEAFIRADGFAKLGLFPTAMPYVVKPLVVGLLPKKLLDWLKKKYYRL